MSNSETHSPSLSLSDLVFNAIGDGIWDWNVQSGRITRSPKCQEMLGYGTVGRAVGFEDYVGAIHPEDRLKVHAGIRKCLEQGIPFAAEYRIADAAGNYIWVLDRGDVVDREADGQARRMIGSLRDISDRVRIARRLEESESRFTDLAENIPGAIFRYVQHEDGTNRVDYMSPGCLRIWEVTADEVKKDASVLWEMVDPADLPGMQESVMRSASTMTPWLHTWRITTPSGKRKWLQGRGRPQSLSKDSVLWNSLILDISETKQMETQLAESAKLDALGQLTGGIAHDFNNYLGVILGNLDLLNERADLPAAEQKLLKAALRAAESSAQLTESLLAFSRRKPLEAKRIKVGDLLDRTAAMLERTLGGQIDVRVEHAGDQPSIMIDVAQLESALINLANNARDAMPDGGVLTFSARMIEPHEGEALGFVQLSGPGVMIEVADTGEGMDEETLRSATEPFFTTKPVGRGTGLGLSMVYGFVSQSNGAMVIDSAPGEGARIRICLPADKPSRPSGPGENALARAMPRSGQTILIVEDNPALLATATEQLESLGYVVQTAKDGNAALKAMKNRGAPPDIVFSDVILTGGLSGVDVATAAREKGLPVVLTSGFPDHPSLKVGGLPSDIALLAKPYSREDLNIALQEALSGGALNEAES